MDFMKKVFVTFLLATTILVAACKNDADPGKSPESELVATPSSLSPDKGAFIGQVMAISSSEPTPLSNTEVRLAQIFWDETQEQGAYVIEGGSSPTTITDVNGRFVFTNLDIQDYAIVVGDLYGVYEVLAHDDGRAQIFTPKAGSVENIGVIEINLEGVPPQIPTAESYPVPLNEKPDDAYP